MWIFLNVLMSLVVGKKIKLIAVKAKGLRNKDIEKTEKISQHFHISESPSNFSSIKSPATSAITKESTYYFDVYP